MDWQRVGMGIVDGLTLMGNGFMALLYWFWDQALVALTWPLAVGVLALLDGEIARQAGHRARRHGRGKVQQESGSVYLGTVGLAAAWTVVGLISPSPIPLIGLAMWATLLLTPLAIPMERAQMLSRLKWMLAVYTAAVAGFFLLMRSELSPQALAAWSRNLGQPGAGAALEAAVVGSITPYAATVLWVIGPLMYFGYVAQRFAVHSKTRVSPWMTVEARIRQLRGRGEG
ncbi:MAG: hypothetical protein GY835_22740 [bacterium]|nr:hypothetical protein [bacterium]